MDPESPDTTQAAARGTDLARALDSRHIQLIALGSAIGVGLFLGSARAIHQAGPALLLAYAMGGAAVFMVARALGELLLYRPVTGSVATYAEEFLGAWAGFLTGWSFWLLYLVAGVAEITAVGIYVQYWVPWVPQWIPALVTLVVLTGTNLQAVGVFGELEFWFALVKIVAVVALLLFSALVLTFGFGGDLATTARVSNLWTHGGVLPHGALGLALAMPIAAFAFGGVELIGMTAGEARDPGRSLPRAVNGVLYRILVFYIGAIAAILTLVPWDELPTNESPFVLAFDHFGIPAAATVVNLVVITAAASACNSGLFSTGRMLRSLAQTGQAPRVLARISASRVPDAAVLASATLMLAGVALNYLVPQRIFVYVISVALSLQLWTWGAIILAQLGYRRAIRAGTAPPSSFRMPGVPYTNYFTLLFLVAVATTLALDPGTIVALYVAPIWFGGVSAGFFAWRRATKVSRRRRPFS